MSANGVWLVVDFAAGNVRVMEHEGDYKEGDMLVEITAGILGVNMRVLRSAND